MAAKKASQCATLGPDQAELFVFFARGSPTAPNAEGAGHGHKKLPIGGRRSFREACIGHANEGKDQDNAVWQLLEPATDTWQPALLSRRRSNRFIVRHKVAHRHPPAVIAVLSSLRVAAEALGQIAEVEASHCSSFCSRERD
jgi:hypothetical protein